MFNGAIAFNQDIGSWQVGNLAFAQNMFLNAGLSTYNYDQLLIGWAGQSVSDNVVFHAGNSQYCQGATAHESLILNKILGYNGRW